MSDTAAGLRHDSSAQEKQAFVYVIGGSATPVKVGKSGDPKARLRAVPTGSPYAVSMCPKSHHRSQFSDKPLANQPLTL